MLLFSRFRNAAGKAGSLLLRFLDTFPTPGSMLLRPHLPPPPGWPGLPEWVKDASAERQKTLEAIFSSQRPDLTSAQSPAESPRSTDPQSSAQVDPLLELETGKRRDRLTKHDIDRAEAACATLSRQGFTWEGGAYWKPPLGKPPAYVHQNGEVRDTAYQLGRIADRLGVPVSTLTGPKPQAERDEDVRVFPRAGGAARALEGLGWRWIAGQWIAPPPVGLEEGTAENLRDAIAYALDDHNPDGLEWLRSWNEGDPSAQAELEEWRERERRAAAQRRSSAATLDQIAARDHARVKPRLLCQSCRTPTACVAEGCIRPGA
jgi:hypothetical protein